MIRKYGCLLSAVGAPVVALLAAISHARTKTGIAAQVATFVLQVPLIVLVTVAWLLGWSFLIWSAVGLVAS